MKLPAPRLLIPVISTVSLLSSCKTAPSPLFLAADGDHNGTIDKSELNHYIAGRMMGSYDTNTDGKISFTEWKAVKPEAQQSKFAQSDTNHDGQIDAAELLHAVSVGPTFGRLMESIDKNGDGAAQPAELEAFEGHMDEI